MPELRSFFCLLFQFFQEFHIREINLSKPFKVKQVNDNGDADSKQAPEYMWVEEIQF